MIAYCIFMNDSIEGVIIDDKDFAIEYMIKKAHDYYNRNLHAFETPEDYKIRCFWHIHDVPIAER